MPDEYMSHTISRRLRRPGELGVALRYHDVREALCRGIARGCALLSWGSSVISAARLHMREMVDSLVSLCVSPMVPRKVSDDGGVNRNLTPAAVCRHVTFAVAASYALGSAARLRRLLSCVPGYRPCMSSLGEWQLSAPGIRYDKCMSAASQQ